VVPLLPLLAAFAVQCTDPPSPPNGFVYEELFDEVVTFSDGETTTATIRWPRDPAGPCGWPLIVFVHGLFGSKLSVGQLTRDFAEAGYFAVAFDVRGHASASGYHTLWGQRERLDVVEVIQWAQSSFPALIDDDRIGLCGTSQGAILSFSTAAWGGRPIEPNPWIQGTYPTIDAIVVENLTADFVSSLSPQSLGVHCNSAGALMTSLEVRFDPALVQQAVAGFLAQDPGVWAGIIGDPTRCFGQLVPTTNSAVLAMTAWDDFWFPAAELVDTLSSLPPSSPAKLYLGTVGHSTPANQTERQLRAEWREKWFDRFLKGDPNGIESGPWITYARTPASPAEYLSTGSTWQRRTSDTWPPAGTYGYRLHLRSGSRLSFLAPLGAEPPDALHQTVSPGFGPPQLVATGFRLPQVQAGVPRVSLQWTGDALAAPLAFAGDPIVRARVVPSYEQWQLAASLWDVAPDLSERYVTSGSVFVDQPGSAGQERTVDVVLNANSYEFPAGHSIRVRLQNLHVHEPPVGQVLRYGPVLHDFDLEIRHDLAGSSWLELPVSESAAVPYGWSQVNSQGCTPSTSGSGIASASDPTPFWIEAHDVLNQKQGLLVYGFTPAQVPLNGAWLWVQAPLRRSSLLSSGGKPPPDDCSGVLRFDFNARIRSGLDPWLIPGARVGAQFWSRDPVAPSSTNLTNAVEFSIVP
jgi:predicted acyl esterase